MAVSLLIAIAGVLAWGTIYEARFGTAAVQRVVYTSWWFQALLGFLAINLAIAALERYPWQRKHTPFVMAHIGIILILFGGIIGGRFGIDGQLIIAEGQAERVLQLPQNVLAVHQTNPGLTHALPTSFESRAWVHEPNTLFRVPVKDGQWLELTVDRYYPDAQVTEEIVEGGEQDNPALRVTLRHEEQQEEAWLLARDPERFGLRWGDAHVLFLEPATDQQAAQLMGEHDAATHPRGVIALRLPGERSAREIPVPEAPGAPVPLKGSPYVLTFKDYFPDFAITEEGVTSRSAEPNNPAVSLLLSGPEGTDTHLLFALHPDFPAMHGRAHVIQAEIRYTHPAGSALPPNAIALIRKPSGKLVAVMTGAAAAERQVIDPVAVSTRYTHPWLQYEVEVAAYHPRARVIQHVSNRSNEVRAEALHVVGRLGEQKAEAWVGMRQSVELPLTPEPVIVEYRPAQRELPVAIKLSDFRKIDYPGIDMAAGFESDVQLTDTQRGIILMRTISMNNPLRYRGYSFYQSSFIDGPIQTTVLSVRNDPGTPLVYAGFIIVIGGVVSMFVLRAQTKPVGARKPRRRRAS